MEASTRHRISLGETNAFDQIAGPSCRQNERRRTSLQVFIGSGYKFIKFQKILYCQSNGNYTTIYFREQEKLMSHMVSKSLKVIQEMLPKTLFYRCHQSFLINLEKIAKLRCENIIELRSGDCIPVSRRKKKNLLIQI